MKSAQLALAATLALGALGLQTTQAHANCAMPKDYKPAIDGNTVTICAQADCGTAGTLLREDVATGTVVELANCEGSDGGAYEACWVDECVPAGSYRYGMKAPYSCCSACCGTYYYGSLMGGGATTTVTNPLGECTPSGDPPAAYAGKPPWDGKDQLICTYSGGYGTGGSNNGTGGSNNGTGGSNNGTGGSNNGTGGSNNGTGGANNGTGGANNGTGGSNNGTGGTEAGVGGSNSGAGGANHGAGGVAGSPADAQADPADESGGCSVSGGGLNRMVLGIHAFALVIGLLLTARMRNRRA